jgi:hypothetical protein
MIRRGDDVPGGHCRPFEFGSHVGNRGIERAEPVGEPGADGELTAIHGGLVPLTVSAVRPRLAATRPENSA